MVHRATCCFAATRVARDVTYNNGGGGNVECMGSAADFYITIFMADTDSVQLVTLSPSLRSNGIFFGIFSFEIFIFNF